LKQAFWPFWRLNFVGLMSAENNKSQLINDENTMPIDRASIVNMQPLKMNRRYLRNFANRRGNHSRHRQLQSINDWTHGDKTIALVYVSTPNARPMYSADEFEKAMMGRDTATLKTQVESCSFGKLTLNQAGLYNVVLDQNLEYYTTKQELQQATDKRLQEITGNLNLLYLADKTIFCYPSNPQHDPWFASAGVKYWRIELNSAWCTSLSGSVHEFGHSIGFLHSGLGDDPYGDITGYMGSGSPLALTPLKCFNPVKSAYSGWFDDKRIDMALYAIDNTDRRIQLAALVDYPKTHGNNDTVVLVHIGDDHYLYYNRNKTFNSDTIHANTIVIAKDIGENESRFVAAVNPGESQVICVNGTILFANFHEALVGNATAPDIATFSLTTTNISIAANAFNASNTTGSSANGSGSNSSIPLNCCVQTKAGHHGSSSLALGIVILLLLATYIVTLFRYRRKIARHCRVQSKPHVRTDWKLTPRVADCDST
jgi:hypothetical protein